MADELLRLRPLLGRLVLDYATAESVGQVSKLLADATQGRVVAFAVAAGPLARPTVYDWSQIAHIGHDSVGCG